MILLFVIHQAATRAWLILSRKLSTTEFLGDFQDKRPRAVFTNELGCAEKLRSRLPNERIGGVPVKCTHLPMIHHDSDG